MYLTVKFFLIFIIVFFFFLNQITLPDFLREKCEDCSLYLVDAIALEQEENSGDLPANNHYGKFGGRPAPVFPIINCCLTSAVTGEIFHRKTNIPRAVRPTHV